MSARIDAWAKVDPSAVIADDVTVGAFAVVGKDVVLGPGTEVLSHGVVLGPATIGARNQIHPYACVGGDPQDLSFRPDQVVRVEVGDDNVFREHVTVSRGTLKEKAVTRIGSGCLLMAGAHAAHDCVLGDGVILGNNVLLAGHVHVEDRAILNGAAAVHHFTTIGRGSYVGGLSRIIMDVPPFMVVEGNPARVIKVNAVGLRRGGVPEDRVKAVKKAHRVLWRSDQLVRDRALDRLEKDGTPPEEVLYLIGFLRRQMAGKQGRAREAGRA
jgi:UDP-N-acetylglucosamine acyltransferase